jgi:uncharacterized membrane protein YwzB
MYIYIFLHVHTYIHMYTYIYIHTHILYILYRSRSYQSFLNDQYSKIPKTNRKMLVNKIVTKISLTKQNILSTSHSAG